MGSLISSCPRLLSSISCDMVSVRSMSSRDSLCTSDEAPKPVAYDTPSSCTAGDTLAEGGRGIRAGEAVAERGRGIVTGDAGVLASGGSTIDRLACGGVEVDDSDEGEGVVRVSEGVRVRERGRRKATLRSLSNGDGCRKAGSC